MCHDPDSRPPAFTAPLVAVAESGPLTVTSGDGTEIADALEAAGVRHDITVYPGMEHSFFDHAEPGNATVCADAWLRVVAFLKGAGGGVRPSDTPKSAHSPR
jgi:carboxymethylenebutenolidase